MRKEFTKNVTMHSTVKQDPSSGRQLTSWNNLQQMSFCDEEAAFYKHLEKFVSGKLLFIYIPKLDFRGQ